MKFIDPQATLLQLGLRDGMKVADLGTGSGHYAFAAAGAVGTGGRVYAVDVQQDVLVRLRDEAERRGIRTIETVWGNIEAPGGTSLKEHSLDAVVLSNTLFQLEDSPRALAEIRRIVKPSGSVLLVEWSGPHGGMGPSADLVVEERAAEERFRAAGFAKVKSCEAGPHHYAMVFAPEPASA